MEAEIVKEPTKKVEEAPPFEKQGAKLKNWSYYQGFFGPELSGNVYDHPRFQDGDFIYTSRVVAINKEIGIAETLNTVYILIGKQEEHPTSL